MSTQGTPPRGEAHAYPQPGDIDGTIQLLVADEGSRRAIRSMLEGHFEIITKESVAPADLYLVEDRLLQTHREGIAAQLGEAAQSFCPVVAIQSTGQTVPPVIQIESDANVPIYIDDVVSAPVNGSHLIRRLHSLLIRRKQSLELMERATVLEEREKKLRRYERAVESSGNGILLIDTEGVIETVNPAFEEITGYSTDDIEGRSPQFLQPDDSEAVFTADFWRTMTDVQEWEGELLLEQKGGTRCVANATITAISEEDTVEGFVMVMADMTERIQRERELAKNEAELDLLRQVLIRYLRHNLRNDLTVIQGYGQLLAESTLPTTRQDRWVGNILDGANRLLETADKARKYSTLIQQDAELIEFDLAEFVSSETTDLQNQYPQVAFELDIPASYSIHATEGIKDAVRGLVENAVIHNHSGSPAVAIEIREMDGTRLIIEDNGPGIPEDELAVLEAGEETPLSHMQGVGLWLSKWVIESFDGDLRFETSENGTRVTVHIPTPDDVGTDGLDVPYHKEREQRLETVLNRMTDAVLEIDAHWSITFIDKRAEEILNTDAEQILGQDFWNQFADGLEASFQEVCRKSMENRTTERVVVFYQPSRSWLEVVVYPEFDGGLSFYFRDVTERREREQELEQARSRMELALEGTDAAVWEWNVETDAVTVHPEIHPVSGTEIQSVEDFLESLYPADRSRVLQSLETAVETGEPFNVEYRVQVDGNVRWAADYGEVQYEGGNAKRMIGVARDITERKRREEELSQQRELLERTEQIADVGGWEIDTETMDVYWSDSLYEILGIEQKVQPSLDDALDLYHEDDRPMIEDSVGAALDSGDPFDLEARVLRPNGDVRWLHVQGEPTMTDGEVLTLRGAVQDVTERKDREQHLKEEQQFVKSIFDALPDLLYAFDTGGTLLRWNDQFEVATGYDSTELSELAMIEFVPNDEAEKIATEFQSLLNDGISRTVESALETKEGDRIPYEYTGAVLEDATGDVRGITGIGRDIADRKQRERLLEAERQKFQSLVEVLPHGVYRADPETFATEFVNEAFMQIHGSTVDEWDGKTDRWEQALHPDDAAFVKETLHAHREAGAPGEIEYRIETSEGETHWVKDTFRWEFDDEGGISALVEVYTDITARMKHERENEDLIRTLAQSEEKLELALEAGEMGMWELDLQSEEAPIRTFQHDRIFGYDEPVADWGFDIFLEHVHPDDREEIERTYEEAFDSGTWEFECRIHRVDGSLRWIAATGEFFYDADGNPDYAVGVVADCTDRKEREQALEERIKELTAIQQTAQTFLQNNETIDELFQEFVEELPRSFQYPERTAARLTYDSKEIATSDFEPGYPSISSEASIGKESTLTIEVANIRGDSDETVTGFLSEEQDLLDTLVAIAQGELVKQSKREELQRLRDLLHTAEELGNIGVWEYDRETEAVFWFAGTRRIHGVDNDYEPTIENALQFYHPDDRGKIANAIAETSTAGEEFHEEARLCIGPDEVRWIIVNGRLLPDGTTLRGYIQDITEQHEYQERLEEFAQMVSHDIRNPLSVAKGRLDLYHQRNDEADLTSVERALSRIEEITTDIAALARFGSLDTETEPVSLEATARNAWQMVDTVDAELQVDDRKIIADQSQLQTIFENLFKNAVGHGGSDVTIRVGPLTDGFYVEDTGTGIPPEIRDQIFRSGFSTGYSGSGVGLAIVSRCVEHHGWDISLGTSEESGARFEIKGVASP